MLDNFVLYISNSKTGEYYEISKAETINKIYISDGDGEGGEFSADEFFKIIDKFYKENF